MTFIVTNLVPQNKSIHSKGVSICFNGPNFSEVQVHNMNKLGIGLLLGSCFIGSQTFPKLSTEHFIELANNINLQMTKSQQVINSIISKEANPHECLIRSNAKYQRQRDFTNR